MLPEVAMFYGEEAEPEQTANNVTNLTDPNMIQPIVSPSIHLELTNISPGMNSWALPNLVPGIRYRNREVKLITCDTLACLIQGEFVEQLGPATVYQIIDCRYPYQFMDGHIMGARNLYSRHKILRAFPMVKMANETRATMESYQQQLRRRPCIYVFYCKYSLERAPKLLSFLRGKDRRLDYPELYLLHGGYKKFSNLHRQLCGM